MIPTSLYSAVPFWLPLILLIPVSGYCLMVACNFCGADTPTFKKSMLISTVVAAAAFFLFDVMGYYLVLGTRDISHIELGPTYTYFSWLKEPMYLKWQAMGLVPVLRYLPLLFAVLLAAVLYIFMLGDTYRIVVVILLMQWVLTVVIVSVMMFVLSIVLGVTHRMGGPEAAPSEGQTASPEGQQQASRGDPRSMTRPRTRQPVAPGQEGHPEEPHPVDESALKSLPGSVELKQALTNYKEKLSPGLAHFKEQVDGFVAWADPHLEPIKEACHPFTQYLPPVIQEFLDDGGWIWVLSAVSILGFYGIYSSFRRAGKTSRKKKRSKAKLKKLVHIDLDEVSEGFTEPGPNQITVKNFPGRIRLVIMAPASSYVGDLLPEMAESLLDYLQPGLGEVYDRDNPRVVVWPRTTTEGRFRELVNTGVTIPEPRGKKTNWVLLQGTATLARQRIYLCVGVHLDKGSYIREIAVGKDQWPLVLGVQESVLD